MTNKEKNDRKKTLQFYLFLFSKLTSESQKRDHDHIAKQSQPSSYRIQASGRKIQIGFPTSDLHSYVQSRTVSSWQQEADCANPSNLYTACSPHSGRLGQSIRTGRSVEGKKCLLSLHSNHNAVLSHVNQSNCLGTRSRVPLAKQLISRCFFFCRTGIQAKSLNPTIQFGPGSYWTC